MNTPSTTLRLLPAALLISASLTAQASLIAIVPGGQGLTQSEVFAVETAPFSSSLLSTVNTGSLAGIDIHPDTADLWASGGAASGGMLFRIDRTTGALTTVGATGFSRVPGLAFAPDGTLYGLARNLMSDPDMLITINQTTGAGTVVGPLGTSGIGAITFHPQTGELFATGSRAMPNAIFSVDLTNGATTLFGNVTGLTGGLRGLTLDCLGMAYGSTTSGNIVIINLASLTVQQVGGVSPNGVGDIVALRSPNVSGPCGGGHTICDSTAPRIGTNWEVIETSFGAPNDCGGLSFMLLGGCGQPTPLNNFACAQCLGCQVYVSPILATVPWSNAQFTLPIPNDPNLIGAQLCVQNLCLEGGPTCVCPSNTIRMTVRI